MGKYDFIKTIAVISCEEANAEVLCKVPEKKRCLKRDISKIENSLNHSVYYIQTDSNRKICIVFNVSLQFIKNLAFEYERCSFVFATLEEDGLHCQYFEKEDVMLPAFKWNPHIEVDVWQNTTMDNCCKISHKGVNDFEILIPQTVLENINSTIERNLGKEYDKSRFEKDINMVGIAGFAFRLKANKYLSPYTSN